MAEFTPITIESQEQFDELVKDRLERHQTKVTEEVKAGYADYEDLKKAAADYDTDKKTWETEKSAWETEKSAWETEKSAWETEKSAWETEKSDYEKKLTDTAGKLKTYETESAKVKAIKDAGIPADAWDDAAKLITGSNEAELKAGAESLKKLLGISVKKGLPRKQPEDEGGGGGNSGYAELLKQLSEGE